uniref:NADH dehydrogenase subunit 6 n=1 Tax=Epophthalmia elegans TaxID=346097 RepID=UPI001436ACEE|nr:NADH dehydrogenase subunit 6 [Epophthalmia elegans]QIH29905.1 NADH dehydrogenase subunit 6 [Epophthalmia elegans]
MSQIIILMLLTLNTMTFSIMNHPMNMGMILLMQTLISCLFIGLTLQSTWFSYILFLVFLGGMLVLFIYMTSVASNEMFKKQNMMMFTMIMIISFIMLIFMIMDPSITISTMNQETYNQHFYNHDQNMESLSLIYSYPFSIITMLMVMYLFLTLIIVVYITKFNKGPLRMMN